MRNMLIGLGLAAGLFAGTAWAAGEPLAPGRLLQFTDIGRVVSWRPAGPRLIYLKDAKEAWYKVEMLEPCMDIFPGKEPTFITLTDTEGQRYSAVIIERHQCSVTALERLDEPPPRTVYTPPQPKAAAKAPAEKKK